MSGSDELQANRPRWPRPPLAPQPRLINVRGRFVSPHDAKGPQTVIYRFRVASRVAA